MKTKSCLAVFFKTPTLGKVKTRLASQIGDEMSLTVYKQMLNETVKKMCNLKTIDTIGFYDGEITKEDYPFKCYKQEGRDLGERLSNAFERLFDGGYEKVCIIGADTPTLPEKYLYSAFKMLDLVDVVVGPTMDGGYYLIGLKEVNQLLFNNISWGSNMVFNQTIRVIEGLRLTYHILPKWFDVDVIEDLLRMFTFKQKTKAT